MAENTREWLPTAWLDEAVPRMQPLPETFAELHEGKWRLAPPEGDEGEADGPAAAEAARGRISRFREETRDKRISIAREAEHRFGRKVAWGARCGEQSRLFTHLAVPVMTRLRQTERTVLDTLVESGVARSRADALAWCVRLVGQHSEDWLEQLREAMSSVERLREQGPAA